MPNYKSDIPLSLYIHLPWCVRKCPYCDFNSHALKNHFPEKEYVLALERQLQTVNEARQIQTIFFGGGTPSLFSPAAIENILTLVQKTFALSTDIEITLEANPGTVDNDHLQGYNTVGVNRISLGVQSFNDRHLKTLGRIHDRTLVFKALSMIQTAGFKNYNIDLMYGLPHQTVDESLEDLNQAFEYAPSHVSWYQLTIEPNTLFHHQSPPMLSDDRIYDMQQAGEAHLSQNGFEQYEVSAYARQREVCRHNLNYWQFGDYLGIGAGAHSKITCLDTGKIVRFAQMKHPKLYMAHHKKPTSSELSDHDKIFEFMLNALRLTNGFEAALFESRTGLSRQCLEKEIDLAVKKSLLEVHKEKLTPTPLGKRFLNDLTAIFLR